MKGSENHYATLGVGRNTDQQGIRDAYRKAAKRLHPDAVGTTDSGAFRAVQEAYEVLSDEQSRALYDRDTSRHAFGTNVTGRSPLRPSRPVVYPNSWRHETRRLDVFLSRWEAMQGGRLRVPVDTLVPCPLCRSQPSLEQLLCTYCGGSGVASRLVHVELYIPPGVQNGAVILFRALGEEFEALVIVE